MALLHYLWSRVAANNATADAAINMAEGMAPSAVNDGIRALMASAAGFRDDIAGAIVTSGTSTAYTVASYQVFDSLAHMNGQMVAFSPHATNGATVTLNVDGLGAKPLRSAPSTELLAGVLIQGTPYTAVYNSSDAAFYLHGFFGNPYNVPLLGGMDYWDTIAPNSSFIFPLGQAISRTTYAATFARWGTTYGAGDGSTTFNVPDKGERVSVMKVATGTRLTTAASGVDGGTMGSTGGSQTHTLTTAELPVHSHANTLTDPGHAHNVSVGSAGGGAIVTQGSGASSPVAAVNSNTTGITINNVNAGSGNAHAIVQPTIVTNYIIRII
jgi:microcystin-dependent protein